MAFGDAWQSCQHLFAAVARERADAPALLTGQGSVSYRELAARAGSVAAWLEEHGAGPDRIVAVLAEQSPDLAACALGTWLAGAAYLPLDLLAPRARLRGILDEVRPVALLTQPGLRQRIASYPGPVLALGRGIAAARPRRIREPGPDHLAYVIYTSGSTGRPRGVSVSHRALLAILADWIRIYGLGTEVATVLQAAAPGFDVATGDIVRALLTGCSLVTCPRETLLTPRELHALMRRTGTDYAELTPSLLRPFVRQLAEDGLRLDFMRCIVVGAEYWTAADYRLLRDVAGERVRIFNTYGLTECAIDSCYYETDGALAADQSVPIGRPFGPTRLHVLDDELRPADEGELYVEGVQLARGYHGDPVATADRFVPAPFGPPGARAYRTGDQVRRLASGDLTYLGRRDDQVKVRGVRVQPLELADTLAGHPQVQSAVAVPYAAQDGVELAAYVVPRHAPEAGELDAAALRHYAATRLPPAMVPSVVVLLDRFPVTPNGKVDRSRLPPPTAAAGQPAGTGSAAQEPDREPGTGTGPRLAAVLGRLLGRPVGSADADFFGLGGNSLLAAQAVAAINAKFGVRLTLAALFDNPTIGGLEQLLAGTLHGSPTAPGRIPAHHAGYEGPLHPGQHRMWVLDQMEGGLSRYNIPALVRIRGPLDEHLLVATLNCLVRRHAALRTAFPMTASGPVQRVDDPVDLPLERGDASEAWLETFSRLPFDLGRPPLIRAALCREPGGHLLALAMHHIVSDGWTLRILLRDLGTIYSALAAGAEPDLPGLPVSYLDYSSWSARRLRDGDFDGQRAYWERRLAGAPQPLRLPSPACGRDAPARYVRRLGPDLADAVRGLARERRATLFVTLLSAMFGLLHRWSGADDIVIGVPFGDRAMSETTDLAGFFVRTVALRVGVRPAATFADLVAGVKAAVSEAARAQDVPFHVVQQALRLAGSAAPFATWFNFLGPPDVPPVMAGLTTSLPRPPVSGAPFDLNVYVTDLPDDIEIEMVFHTGRTDGVHVSAFTGQFVTLLRRAAADPDAPLARHVLGDGRAEPDPAAARACASLPQRIAEVISADPAAPAIRGPVSQLSRGEVGAWAGQIADHLARHGAGPGTVIAVYAHRHASLVATLLGVLETGAAFCLLDSGYPASRLAARLRTVRPALLAHLASAGPLPADLASAAAALVEIAGRPDRPERLDHPGGAGAARGAPVGDLAYVAFTSGTSGEPAAVYGDQNPVAHFVDVYSARFGIGAADRFAMLSGLGHDPLLRDVFVPLCTGATLCIPRPELIRAPQELAAWLAAEMVTIVHVTPPLTRLLAAAGAALPQLRLVVCAGDLLRAGDVAALRRVAPGAIVVNAYGTTETPQIVSWHVIGPDCPVGAEPGPPLPVGSGIGGARLLVTDAAGRPTAVGEPGRVSVRSPYLTRGLGDSYITGDVGRRCPDGSVVVLGRADGQVNIAGHRVNPAEVESAIARQPYVLDSVTVGRPGPGGEPRLVTYLVPRGEPPTLEQLRRDLRRDLPQHLLPGALVVTGQLPLTPNGKVDTAALPQAGLTAAPAAASVAPRTEIERRVAAIWGAVLGTDTSGIDASFFDVGGTSILMAHLQQRLERELRIQVPITTLFAHPTVRALASHLAHGEPGPLDGRRGGIVPAVPDSRRRQAIRRVLRQELD